MKKRIKIFLFIPYPAIGGVDTSISRFIDSIDLSKIDVEYLSLKKVKDNKNKKITFTKIDSKSTFLSFFKIIKIIKKDNHEKKIFFSAQYFVNVWTIIFVKLYLGVKTFIYEVNHLDELNYYTSVKDFFKKKIIKFLVKILYKYSDLVAANSNETAINLELYAKKKIYTLYNPCFDKIKYKKKNYQKDKINILNISRFEEQKDHLTLLKAISILKIKSKINLILVGYGSKLNEIKKFINIYKINAKIYLGHKKLSKFYKKSDLYVCSSLYEGLPTTMIEAASFCLPIISSNFKSGSNEILSKGKSGFIFNVRDYNKLSKYIYKFYKSPQIFFKKEKECRKNLKNYSIKKNTDLFYRLVKSLL